MTSYTMFTPPKVKLPDVKEKCFSVKHLTNVGVYSKQRKHARERFIRISLQVASAVSILTTAGIIAVLLYESYEFFAAVPIWQFLTDTQWTPLFANKHYGILPLLAGTFLTSIIAVLVAVPVGVLSAIYLSEYAANSVRRIVKPALEVLAGIPTVVYGYFALLFVTPLLQKFIPGLSGFNSLGPGIVTGVMIIPMVSSLSEDAMYAVPQSLREAAYALGSSKLKVALNVVVPSAFSGIAASFLLAISRAIGETMIVAIASGQQPRLTLSPMVPIETMTAYIVQVSLGDTPHGTLEYKTIFAVGTMLFVFTLILNLVSHWMKDRYREKYA